MLAEPRGARAFSGETAEERMPTYEYACKSCGEHLEVSQSFEDPALTTCPRCGGELRKVFGSVGIVLKGSGFYRTDSRGPAPAESTRGASSDESASGGPEGGPGHDGSGKGSRDGSGKAAAEGSGKTAEGAKPESKPAKPKPDSAAAAS